MITEPRWIVELRQLPFKPNKIELALNFYDEMKTPAARLMALSNLEHVIITWNINAERKEAGFTEKERNFYNWTLNF